MLGGKKGPPRFCPAPAHLFCIFLMDEERGEDCCHSQLVLLGDVGTLAERMRSLVDVCKRLETDGIDDDLNRHRSQCIADSVDLLDQVREILRVEYNDPIEYSDEEDEWSDHDSDEYDSEVEDRPPRKKKCALEACDVCKKPVSDPETVSLNELLHG